MEAFHSVVVDFLVPYFYFTLAMTRVLDGYPSPSFSSVFVTISLHSCFVIHSSLIIIIIIIILIINYFPLIPVTLTIHMLILVPNCINS
jgi:hypothetical protein